MSEDRHKYFVELYDDWHAFHVECPYDPSDRERPCWPRNEDGTLDENGAADCNHVDWLGNIGTEMVQGQLTIEVAARWDWSVGVYPVLRLGEPTDE